MRRKNIYIGSTYTDSTRSGLFKIIKRGRPGLWNIEYIMGQYHLLYNNEVKEITPNTTRISSRNILCAMTEQEFEEFRQRNLDQLKIHRKSILENQIKGRFEKYFKINSRNWTHAPLLSWVLYFDSSLEKEKSIDSSIQELIVEDQNRLFPMLRARWA